MFAQQPAKSPLNSEPTRCKPRNTGAQKSDVPVGSAVVTVSSKNNFYAAGHHHHVYLRIGRIVECDAARL